MTLSKKYYKEFARILGENKASKDLIMAFCDFFKFDNIRFDRTRFLEYIENEGWKKK